MSKSKALAIPPAETLANAVVPKPTKREIVLAMTQIQHPKDVAEWEAEHVALSNQGSALESEILAYVRSHCKMLEPDRVQLGVYSGDRFSGLAVRLELLNPPAALEKKARAYHEAVKRHRYQALDFEDVQMRIEAKMNGFTNPYERVLRLVNDPESRKALETMLAEVDKK